MGGRLILELRKFGTDGGTTDEVMDDKGRGGVGVSTRRGDM